MISSTPVIVSYAKEGPTPKVNSVTRKASLCDVVPHCQEILFRFAKGFSIRKLAQIARSGRIRFCLSRLGWHRWRIPPGTGAGSLERKCLVSLHWFLIFRIPASTKKHAPMADFLETGKESSRLHAERPSRSSVKLKPLAGNPVVLFFYPQLTTAGVLHQRRCAYRDRPTYEMKARRRPMFDISTDNAESHIKISRDKIPSLPFALLVDEDHAMSEEVRRAWREKTW